MLKHIWEPEASKYCAWDIPSFTSDRANKNLKSRTIDLIMIRYYH